MTQSNHDLIRQQARTIARQQQRIAQLTGGTMQPSEPAYPAFDTPQPSEAERIAALEARVAALEAALAKVPPREYSGWQTVAELYDFEPGASSGELVLRDKKK